LPSSELRLLMPFDPGRSAALAICWRTFLPGGVMNSAVEDRDGVPGEVHAVAVDDGCGPGRCGWTPCGPVRLSRPVRRPVGARAVWALPVTGPLGMPWAGAKKRETKS